eukprot:SAG22_NODE_725_length_7622_cov_1.958926_8_plen_90_part_00
MLLQRQARRYIYWNSLPVPAGRSQLLLLLLLLRMYAGWVVPLQVGLLTFLETAVRDYVSFQLQVCATCNVLMCCRLLQATATPMCCRQL